MLSFYQSGCLDDALETNSPKSQWLKTVTCYYSYMVDWPHLHGFRLAVVIWWWGWSHLKALPGWTSTTASSLLFWVPALERLGRLGAGWCRPLPVWPLHGSGLPPIMVAPRTSIPKGKRVEAVVCPFCCFRWLGKLQSCSRFKGRGCGFHLSMGAASEHSWPSLSLHSHHLRECTLGQILIKGFSASVS